MTSVVFCSYEYHSNCKVQLHASHEKECNKYILSSHDTEWWGVPEKYVTSLLLSFYPFLSLFHLTLTFCLSSSISLFVFIFVYLPIYFSINLSNSFFDFSVSLSLLSSSLSHLLSGIFICSDQKIQKKFIRYASLFNYRISVFITSFPLHCTHNSTFGVCALTS